MTHVHQILFCYEESTPAHSMARALSIVDGMEQFLSCIKPFWRRRLVKLFMKYAEDTSIDAKKLMLGRNGIVPLFLQSVFITMTLSLEAE